MKIVIFGISGSGKTTLAKQFVAQYNLAHLDLDTLAWLDVEPPKRKPISESNLLIKDFLNTHQNWVIEGCYSDLLSIVSANATNLIYLNPTIETCVKNCTNRQWEPHKYETKEQQDSNLHMLIDWVKKYKTRTDEFSEKSHTKLFDQFSGHKVVINNLEKMKNLHMHTK